MKLVCFGGGNELGPHLYGDDWMVEPIEYAKGGSQAHEFALIKFLTPDILPKNQMGPSKAQKEGVRLELIFENTADAKQWLNEEHTIIGLSKRTTTSIYQLKAVRIGNGLLPVKWSERQIMGTAEGGMITLGTTSALEEAKSKLGGKIDPGKLQSAIDKLLKPDEKFSDQSKIIVEAVKDKKISPEVGKRLILAMREFGNYIYGMAEDHNSTHYVGACGLMSNKFETLCDEKFRLVIDQLNTYKILPLDELYAGGGEDLSESVHIFNACGVLGIDWTYRQFGGDLPFSRVFRLDQSDRNYYVYPSPGRRNIVYVPSPAEELLRKNE